MTLPFGLLHDQFQWIRDDDLWREWDEQCLLLTANRRMGRSALSRHSGFMESQQREVWQTPRILPWGTWLQQLVEDGVLSGSCPAAEVPRLVLSDFQERLLWEQQIENLESEGFLLSTTLAASAAMEAWRLMHQWNVPLEKYLSATTNRLGLDCGHIPELQAFLRWATIFESTLKENRWIDQARLPHLVERMIRKVALPLPSRLFLMGFDELSPVQIRLLEAVMARGCTVIQVIAQDHCALGGHVAMADSESEYWSAAHWALARLQVNPAARIAIVIPQLEQVRHQVESVFDAVFYPQWDFSPESRLRTAYNITAGRTLASVPMVDIALLLLDRLHRNVELTQAEISGVLLSPFLPGYGEEFNHRVLLDLQLRQRQQVSLPLAAVIRLAASRHCPRLVKFLRELGAGMQELRSRKARPGQWSERLSQLLTRAGWPGDRRLNSDEYQALEAWNTMLYTFSHCDPIVAELPLGDALKLISTMAHQTIHQPHSYGEAPVQVMGMLEAGGAHFDAMWIMGLHDEAWPAEPRPNPLIPGAVQRLHQLPRSSPRREWEYASALTHRFLESADEVIFSYPASEGDRHLRPSPLITGRRELSLRELRLEEATATSPLGQLLATASLQTLEDTHAHGLPADTLLRGGASVLKDQALCPFRGIGLHILGATAPCGALAGVNPMVRGILLHSALEDIWNKLESSRGLQKMEARKRRQFIEDSLGRAIQRLQHELNITIAPALAQMEVQMQAQWIDDWLEYEKTRPPFTVASLERYHHISLGGLQLKLKVDRIDQLENGQHVLIDYKTGQASARDWEGERPADPQLPLYAVTLQDTSIGAVAYALINREACHFRGLAMEEGMLPELGALPDQQSWQTMLQNWKAALENLAGEITSGYGAISPRDDISCRYCPLPLLCRIDGNEGDEER